MARRPVNVAGLVQRSHRDSEVSEPVETPPPTSPDAPSAVQEAPPGQEAPPAEKKVSRPAKPPASAKRRTAPPVQRTPSEPATAERTEETSPVHTEGPPKVLAVETSAAVRMTLYLHPDDHRALFQARLEDRAPANARVLAMIALWRSDPKLRARVDKLARTAPRGGQR